MAELIKLRRSLYSISLLTLIFEYLTLWRIILEYILRKILYSIIFVLLGFLSEKYKYLVSIYIESSEENKAFNCGGGILSNRMILTAAHCFVKRPNNYISDHNKLIVTAHTLTRATGAAIEGSIKRKVERIYVPTEYFGDGYADIAILRLKKSLNLVVNFNKLAKLTLPEANFMTHGQLAVIAGYGAHRIDGNEYISDDDALRTLNVEIVHSPNADINERLVQARTTNTEVARGFCEGDSGSLLVIKKKTYAGLSTDYIVVGVALGNSDACDDRTKPGSYTRVTRYLNNFINTVMDNPDVNDPKITFRYGALSCYSFRKTYAI